MQSEYIPLESSNVTYTHKLDNHTIPDQLNSDSNDSLSQGYDIDRSCYDYIEDCKVALAIKVALFTSILLVAVGIVGNFINVIVMSRNLRKHSSSVYIFLLAISDSVYLTSTFLGDLLRTLKCYFFRETTIDFVSHSNFACKLYQYLLELSADYSSMIILCFTIERFAAVYKPMKVKIMCSTNKVKLLCFILLLVTSISTAPQKFMMIDTYYHVCGVGEHWEQIYFVAYLVELTVFRIVPVILIIIFNALIIYQMVRKKVVKSRKTQGRNYSGKSITVILILISTSYIVLYLPALIHLILEKLRYMGIITLSKNEIEISYRYTNMLYTCAFAINFYLYSFGSKLFRQQLKETYSSICSSMSFGFGGNN